MFATLINVNNVQKSTLQNLHPNAEMTNAMITLINQTPFGYDRHHFPLAYRHVHNHIIISTKFQLFLTIIAIFYALKIVVSAPVFALSGVLSHGFLQSPYVALFCFLQLLLPTVPALFFHLLSLV